MSTEPETGPVERSPVSRRAPRYRAWAVAAVSLVALVVSSVTLARRLDAYNRANPKPIYTFRQIEQPNMRFAGREIRVTDQLDADGRGTVTISYADQTLAVPVSVPTPNQIPGMARHQDWFKMLIFGDRTGMSIDEFQASVDAGDTDLRVIAAVRAPRPGDDEDGLFKVDIDPDSWGFGETMRSAWTFTFHELLPEGGFRTHGPYNFPESGKSLLRRQARALRNGEPIPQRDPDDLIESTWTYDAAFFVMPRPPAITFERQALRNAGWALPVASGSILTLMLSIAWALAPGRPRAS